MTNECDNLDAYLADDLPTVDAARFAQHVAECDECRDAMAQQRWIDSLLHSAEIASLKTVPPALRDSVNTSIARRHQPTRLIACGLAAAATLAIVALGWTLKLNRQADGPRIPATGQVATQSGPVNPESVDAASPRATFVSNGDTIAVPFESADDEVTIVQLYPTTETVRRTRNELAFELLYSESNGG